MALVPRFPEFEKLLVEEKRKVLEHQVWAGWWFQTFFISARKLGKGSNLTSIFFRWVGSTTN